jgi:hypothetical protein
MKTLPIATALIAVLCPLAAYADMQGGTPDGAVTPASGRVSPALQLPVNAAPPIACSSATLDEPSDWRAAR